ncbi:hypothetical protein ACHHYP_10651 [Achlya hypogyna]|uniref:Secreted protein n=1 Tax=Achlya hypogyna TaxID=1202772 RepID=A0A1V9YKZ3_ACHHY|nr:hypothetical protein ACHHYP_10651 [Achlya hypogyna]
MVKTALLLGALVAHVVLAQQGSTTHHPEGSTHHPEGTKPHPEGTKPHSEGTTHHPEGTKPRTDGTTHHPEGTKSHTDGANHHPEGTKPHVDGTTHHPEGATHEPAGKGKDHEARSHTPATTGVVHHAEANGKPSSGKADKKPQGTKKSEEKGAHGGAFLEQADPSNYGKKNYGEPKATQGYGKKDQYKQDYDARGTKGYKPKRPVVRTTTAAPLAPGQSEFNQFWNTVTYCDAELALSECLVKCNVINDFASSGRVAKCIEEFTDTVCTSIPADGCNNGRVSLRAESCTNNAVVAAMYTIGEIQKTVIGDELAPVELFKADNPDSFSSIKLAVTMQALVNYGNCLSGSLLNYADTCNSHQYFDARTNQCVAKVLATCDGKSAGEAVIGNPIHLGDILTTLAAPTDPVPVPTPEPLPSPADPGYSPYNGHAYIRKHHTNDAAEIERLSALIKNASTIKYHTVNVNLKRHRNSPNEAEFTVCPNAYTPLNYRLPFSAVTPPMVSAIGGIPAEVAAYDIPGFPINDTAFHFPAQTYDEVAKKWKPAVYAAGSKNQFPAGTPLDPITPAGGIRDTCEKFNFLSMLAWFAGEDTGDYCFTIDGYTAEFVESNEVHPLSWSEVTSAATCPNTQNWNQLVATITAEVTSLASAPAAQIPALSTQLALDQATFLGSYVASPHCASCYKVGWRDQSYCPRHIARFGMQLRCCKSFAHLMAARIAKNPKLPNVPCGTYSPAYDGVCDASDDLEFTHTVYSKVGTGELQPATSSYYTNAAGVTNKIVDLFAIFQGALTTLTAAQQAVFLEALAFFNWNADCKKIPPVGLDRPTRAAWIKKTYPTDGAVCADKPAHTYLKGNSWADSANALVSANVEWSTLIGLEPADGLCYAPTCLVSRYLTCSEQNATSHKKSHYVAPHAQSYRGAKSYSRQLLAAATDVWTLGTVGFVAGVAAIAIGQFVVTARASREDAGSPYQQQLL